MMQQVITDEAQEIGLWCYKDYISRGRNVIEQVIKPITKELWSCVVWWEYQSVRRYLTLILLMWRIG